MYNVAQITAPIYLCDKFTRNNSGYNTRRSENSFAVPHSKGLTSNNFNVMGVKEWNALPPSIKSLNSKQTFKKKG
jgi:hypothetical protein